MAALRATSRVQVGSESWISEERNCALQIAESEAEEFAFSARNELDWLNEHMAEIFDENQINVAEIFKTPGKLRGKTPRTVRKRNPLEARAPLSDFSATPRTAPSPFRQNHPEPFRLNHLERQVPVFEVAEDPPEPLAVNETVAPKPISHSAHSEIFDSGYFGSQVTQATQTYQATQATQATEVNEELQDAHPINLMHTPTNDNIPRTVESASAERRTTEGSFKSAKEEQTLALNLEEPNIEPEANTPAPILDQSEPEAPAVLHTVVGELPSPQRQLPVRAESKSVLKAPAYRDETDLTLKATEVLDDPRSPSDGSSPIRPIVRKSSLAFPSLPAREPLTTKKSFGNRTSRTSHLDQSRASYYGRHMESKAHGDVRRDDIQTGDDMDIDVDGAAESRKEESDADSKITRLHNKTSTQRLQDQISMLGKSQPNAPRPSKSIPNIAAIVPQSVYPTLPSGTLQAASPPRNDRTMAGTFPEDEDDWIGPPTVAATAPSVFSPRPALKSFTTDIMEGIQGKDSISGGDFNVPKQRRDDPSHRSPFREPAIPDRTTSTLGYAKSASTSVLRSPTRDTELAENLHKKGISVSNPNLVSVAENKNGTTTPPKSPSRSYRDSPLKAAKDKMYSILKTSKNLFASSAAASAAAKGAALSPAPARFGSQSTFSFDDIPQAQMATDGLLYPNLSTNARSQTQLDCSPSMGSARKTRASVEREEKRKEKEAKELREALKREEKLEKLREKESEKARAFSQQERERVAAMERQLLARKDQERMAKAVDVDAPRATRSSPRKTKAQLEAEGRLAAAAVSTGNEEKDVEMTNAASMPPPPISTAVSQATKSRDQFKRPVKPMKETAAMNKQAPVVIRVDTGSQRNPQRNQFHPPNSVLAASLAESLAPTTSTMRAVPPQPAQKSKTGGTSLRSKASVSSIKSVSSTTSRVRALEAAAKKKEQEDQEALRKRNLKLENDRKRAAIQEEKQQEQRRQQETAKQREREREYLASQADVKKTSQQTIEKRMEIENAKQQRPPPPAPRPQPVDLTKVALNEKGLPPAPVQRAEQGQARPPSRMASTANRLQEEFTWSTNSAYHNTTKVSHKRPLPQETAEESQSRPQHNGPSNNQHMPDAKRRRTNENQDENMMDSPPRGAMAPPVRQSSIRQKDGPMKSLFPNGYANVPQPSHAGQSLHKATLNSQHMHQVKHAHPMDMAQTSKATITFAPNPAQATGPTHKTPARPAGPTVAAGKSTGKPSAKSSPRYRNRESIDLPEIHTDSESEDEDEGGASGFPVPGWANSPALRSGLIRQEGIDPATVFGLPGEIKLEEVFRNKDRQRFRVRTSSANWSGSDRLTEEEVRRDLEARERLRREGGWSYGLS